MGPSLIGSSFSQSSPTPISLLSLAFFLSQVDHINASGQSHMNSRLRFLKLFTAAVGVGMCSVPYVAYAKDPWRPFENAVAAVARSVLQGGKESGRLLMMERIQEKVPEFVLNPPDVLVPNPTLELAILRSLLMPSGGVHVLYAPPHLGRTTAARRVLRDLQERRRIGGALVMDGSLVDTTNCSPIIWFKAQFSAARPFSSISDALPKPVTAGQKTLNPPVVLLIDHVTELTPNWKAIIQGLAQESVSEKAFVVLLLVSDKRQFDEVLKINGGKKIRPVEYSDKKEGA